MSDQFNSIDLSIVKFPEPNIDEMEFLSPEDVAKILKCSTVTARKLFHREDFPGLLVGKNLKVLKNAFIEWCYQNRT